MNPITLRLTLLCLCIMPFTVTGCGGAPSAYSSSVFSSSSSFVSSSVSSSIAGSSRSSVSSSVIKSSSSSTSSSSTSSSRSSSISSSSNGGGFCNEFIYCANGEDDDPDGDGWGWTGTESCIVGGSEVDSCASRSSSSSNSSSGGSALTCAPNPNVKHVTSIPQQFWQSPANAGTMQKIMYPAHYYYTNQSGGPGDLPRQNQAVNKPLNIYLPPNYNKNVSYPLVVILHGLTDNEDTWVGDRSNPRPKVMLDALISGGVIKPLIAVFPRTCASFNQCSFSDQAIYYFFDNELMKDLLPYLESKYSVATNRECRGLAGFSMGAMQTINLGICRNLKSFASFAPFAAAPTSYSASKIAQCLSEQNQNASYPINYFYNSVGDSDGLAGNSHRSAINGLKDSSPYLSDANFFYHTVPGGHDYSPSMIGLYNFLRAAFPK